MALDSMFSKGSEEVVNFERGQAHGGENGINNLEPFLDLCVSSLRRGHANLLFSVSFQVYQMSPK